MLMARSSGDVDRLQERGGSISIVMRSGLIDFGMFYLERRSWFEGTCAEGAGAQRAASS
jgi:hypothetical protein